MIWLTNWVAAAAKTWEEVVKAFKTKITVKVERIARFGFSYYQQRSNLVRMRGVKLSDADTVSNLLIRILKIDTTNSPELVDVIKLFELAPEVQWTKHDILFRDQAGNMCTVILFKRLDVDAQTVDFLAVKVDSSFQLAKDLLVVTTEKSILGGIYESSKVDIKELNHVVSPDEALQIISFFRIVLLRFIKI